MVFFLEIFEKSMPTPILNPFTVKQIFHTRQRMHSQRLLHVHHNPEVSCLHTLGRQRRSFRRPSK